MSLQTWFFSMQYLESAMQCSLTAPCLTPNCIRVFRWVGACTYMIIQTVTICYILATYPGIVDSQGSTREFDVWGQSTFNPLSRLQYDTWLFFESLGSFITILALFKILRTARLMAKTGSKTVLNKCTMLLHASLLTL